MLVHTLHGCMSQYWVRLLCQRMTTWLLFHGPVSLYVLAFICLCVSLYVLAFICLCVSLYVLAFICLCSSVSLCMNWPLSVYMCLCMYWPLSVHVSVYVLSFICPCVCVCIGLCLSVSVCGSWHTEWAGADAQQTTNTSTEHNNQQYWQRYLLIIGHHCLSVCFSVCLSVSMWWRLSSLSVSLSVCLFLCLCLCDEDSHHCLSVSVCFSVCLCDEDSHHCLSVCVSWYHQDGNTTHCLSICLWYRCWRETSYWFNSRLRPNEWELRIINSGLSADVTWFCDQSELWVAGNNLATPQDTRSRACRSVSVCLILLLVSHNWSLSVTVKTVLQAIMQSTRVYFSTRSMHKNENGRKFTHKK